ncbi:flavonol synthase/flavanone 3-hydroxylase [Trichodelitschia bisporula]|uniref:Flavonol synthase/flavanone 3-hydroxylase n=1 Tax=Trichodelitschia bisporula TaxID=703511 RepID=A0A6G1HVG8_9PEZI|nr:flavonol synthase/flavanone 3-hydroxylase [Trichodelitschia bisporula]
MPPSSIPVLSIAPFLCPTASHDEKADTAATLDAAFRTVGFAHLTAHGIDAAQVDACFSWSKSFFSLPPSTKLLSPHPPSGSHHRGYSAPGVEKLSQNVFTPAELAALRAVPDYKESFDSGNPADATQPNIWPPEGVLPGFQPFMEGFFFELEGVVKAVLRALALALGLEEGFLERKHAQALFQLRLLHYPPIPADMLRKDEAEVARIAAHSDFGTLTLLFQDEIGGLEIQDPVSRRWRSADAVPGAVLVNVGDLLERWSNGRWCSAVHRVVGPEDAEDMIPARYSIPYFATADPGTVIEALPGCWGEDNPKKFEAVTAWDYVQMRMAALYAGSGDDDDED